MPYLRNGWGRSSRISGAGRKQPTMLLKWCKLVYRWLFPVIQRCRVKPVSESPERRLQMSRQGWFALAAKVGDPREVLGDSLKLWGFRGCSERPKSPHTGHLLKKHPKQKRDAEAPHFRSEYYRFRPLWHPGQIAHKSSDPLPPFRAAGRGRRTFHQIFPSTDHSVPPHRARRSCRAS